MNGSRTLCYGVCCQNQMNNKVPLNSGAVREETRLLLFIGGRDMNETHQARAPTVPRTGRPNREPLDVDEVIAYAIALAGDLGVSMLSGFSPRPMVRSSSTRMISSPLYRST